VKIVGVSLVFVVAYTAVRYFSIDIIYDFADIHKRCEDCLYRHLWHELINVITFSSLALLIKFTVDWFEKQRQNDKLLNQNQASELAMLKSQVSPHFLFNTLNNIYSLSIKKSEQTSEAIMKLSDIMRYMLYEANVECVSLESEINYLKSYIELQMFRLKNPDLVNIQIDTQGKHLCITPMLLIPFVENAFKHGDKKCESEAISIYLTTEDKKLSFRIKNRMASDKNGKKDQVGGVGLKNVKRRLDIIYPNKYKLNICTKGGFYEVNLNLEL